MDSPIDLFPSEDVSSAVKLQPLAKRRHDWTRLRGHLREAWAGRDLTRQQVLDKTKVVWCRLDALGVRVAAVAREIYRRARTWVSVQAADLDRIVALAELKHVLAAPIKTEAPPARSRHDLTRTDTLAVMVIAALTSAAVSALMTWNLNPQSQGGVQAVAAVSASPARVPDVAPAHDVTPEPDVTPAPQEPARYVSHASRQAPRVPGATTEPVRTSRAAAGSNSSSARLVVITEPAGARVTVDGVGRGATPITISDLPFGDKRIRVTKQGYASEERIVRVDGTRRARTLRLDLQQVR